MWVMFDNLDHLPFLFYGLRCLDFPRTYFVRKLRITSGLGLVLGGRRPVVLTGHADASWADDQATQRSSQGYTFSLGSGSVLWRSTRSSSVLGSSCEAEIYTGAMAAQELRWLTYLLTDLGEPPRSPPVLLCGDFVIHPELALFCLTGLVTSCSPPLCLWGFSYLYPTHFASSSFLILSHGQPARSYCSAVDFGMPAADFDPMVDEGRGVDFGGCQRRPKKGGANLGEYRLWVADLARSAKQGAELVAPTWEVADLVKLAGGCRLGWSTSTYNFRSTFPEEVDADLVVSGSTK
ncbi:unnamed protein product [Closterium sp. NIES-54]